MMILKGILLGFAIAAPVGPIGVLCIKRTMTHGRTLGFVTGLGAATADGVYGFVAAFGFTSFIQLLMAQQMWLQLLGSAFLLYLAVQTWRAKPAAKPAALAGTSYRRAYASTFLLTLTNPMTILSFIAVFSSLGAIQSGAFTIVIGIVIGSALWWFILSQLAHQLARYVQTAALRVLNYVAAIVLASFALLQIISLL